MTNITGNIRINCCLLRKLYCSRSHYKPDLSSFRPRVAHSSTSSRDIFRPPDAAAWSKRCENLISEGHLPPALSWCEGFSSRQHRPPWTPPSRPEHPCRSRCTERWPCRSGLVRASGWSLADGTCSAQWSCGSARRGTTSCRIGSWEPFVSLWSWPPCAPICRLHSRI